jgi:hypothetical protein
METGLSFEKWKRISKTLDYILSQPVEKTITLILRKI